MPTINAVYLAFIPLLWLGLTFALARLSGWTQLAIRYRADRNDRSTDRDAAEPVARLRSGRIGRIQYHSSLHFRVAERGLFVSVALPFRFGHPELFLPWDEIHDVRNDRRLFSHSVQLSIGRPTIARVVFPGWVKWHLPRGLRPPSSMSPF